MREIGEGDDKLDFKANPNRMPKKRCRMYGVDTADVPVPKLTEGS